VPGKLLCRAGVVGALLAMLVLLAPRLAQAELIPAESFSLTNGLQVVVIENHRAPVVLQMLFYMAGNTDSPPGKSGIAHFLEHLMFKGTPSVPAGEFSRRVALMGGNDNAYTTEDFTAFHQTVASSHLADVMRLEADRMTNLVLAPGQIRSERDVIIEERRQRVDDDPGARLAEMMQAAIFLNHPYRLPVLGWEQEMHGLDETDALAFYRRWYAPNNALLIIDGDTTVAQVKTLAQQIYGPIPSRPLPARQRVDEPPSYAARRLLLTDPTLHQANWQRFYLAPSYRRAPAREAYALALLAQILAGGPTSRLYRHLVVEQRLATGVDAGYDFDKRDYGIFSIAAVPPAGQDMTRLEPAIDAEIRHLLAEGVGDAELAEAKAQIAASAIKARDGLTGPAKIIGTALATGQSLAEIEAWPDRIAAVDRADIMAAAHAVLSPENSVTGQLLPAGKAP
jgi:zinc protease